MYVFSSALDTVLKLQLKPPPQPTHPRPHSPVGILCALARAAFHCCAQLPGLLQPLAAGPWPASSQLGARDKHTQPPVGFKPTTSRLLSGCSAS